MSEYLESLLEPVSLIGLIASIVVLVSMCFDVTTRKGNLLMRSINLVGCAVSIVYGALLGAAGAGTILLNGVLAIVNTRYLVRILKSN